MAVVPVTYKVSDAFGAITQWSDLNSMERTVTWEDPAGTFHYVTAITQNTLQEFFASYSNWRFTVMQFDTDPTDTPAAAFAALKEIWGEFYGRKSQGVEDAVKAFWKIYSFGADYQEDKKVTTAYGKTTDNKATAQQMADTRNKQYMSDTFPSGDNFAFSSLSTSSGTDVKETTKTAAYDGTLKEDAEVVKAGDIANKSGANSWQHESLSGTDTVTTELTGTKGDIADKIRTEVEFRVQTDVAWSIIKQFAYECLWFSGGADA